MPRSSNESETTKNLSDALSIFCREVRNLLRSKSNCMIAFSKFVPAYHNHYGRQCCVYQFGCTKLIEVLESIPHVVQIVGEGNNRYITLTHREQIKRFASDLIKVVKSQPGKILKLSKFSQAYEQVLGRTFRVQDYGTNNINVLLAEIWEGTINIMPIKRELADPSIAKPLFVGPSSAATTLNQLVANCELVSKPYITDDYPDAWFEVPKRERSDKEIKRTKYFVRDVIELLSHMEPEYSVSFSKFIPSYHYYFNRQCKVSIFGFSKLIDLFESISPDVVEIIDQGPGQEKLIKLARLQLPFKMRRRSEMAAAHSNRALASPRDQQIRPEACVKQHQASSEKLEHQRNHIELECVEDEEEEVEVFDQGDDDDDVNEPQEEQQLEDEDEDFEGDDVLLPCTAIDNGPTEEELEELEHELKAYEELKAIQSKHSSRMAAILDIFKYTIY